jgi:molybdate transport system ATP-binding protein
MIQPFTLNLTFSPLKDLVIRNGECLVVRTEDSNLVDNFFTWIEGKKFNRDAKLEYVSGTTSGNDIFLAGRFIGTLRFSSAISSSHYYYQQRYHSTENDAVQTLAEFIGKIEDPYYAHLAGILGLQDILDEKINMLSTGEFRKAILLKAAMAEPSVMFLEDPCTGMDATGCNFFNQLFSHLVQGGASLVIFTPPGNNSGFSTRILDLDRKEGDGYEGALSEILIPETWCKRDFIYAFDLKNIIARYGEHEVLHKVNWRVKRNEHWSLTGHNGAGKSTLLSFVYADNPQVYSNEVWLFDQKRGTGETIWEVKDQIGYYSTEFHRYFDRNQTVESAINSIIFQNPYEKRRLSVGEENFREQLIRYFELENLKMKFLYDIPVVMQKLVLLAGVLLKNAPLLILDEPFQGFSDRMIKKCVALLSKYISNRTFIMVSHNNGEFPASIDCHFHLVKGSGVIKQEVPLNPW